MVARCASDIVVGSIRKRSGVVVAELSDLVERQREEIDDGMAVDLDPGGVDKHKAADPWRTQQRELRSDPAADRVADHGDVLEFQPIEQRRVDAREAGHAVEDVGARRRAEPRMRRRDHPCAAAGKKGRERCNRLRACAPMEEEICVAGAGVGDGDLDWTDAVGDQAVRRVVGHGDCLQTPRSLLVC